MSIAKTTRPHLLTREAAADRIETLETMLKCHTDGRIIMLARIEALEAALREIIAVEVVDPWSACGTMQIKARAALVPEQDK